MWLRGGVRRRQVTFVMQSISKAHVVRAVEVLDELVPLMEVPAR